MGSSIIRDVHLIYRDRLSEAWHRAMLGDRIDVNTASFQIPTADNLRIHAFVAVPHNINRVLFIHPGASHTWSQDCDWITPAFLAEGCAIVYFEQYGHGLLSSPLSATRPGTQDASAMTQAILKAYESGLLHIFNWDARLYDYPIDELGHSMGGGILVHAHQTDPNLSVQTGNGKKQIRSVTLINPRLRLGTNYPLFLRNGIAPWIERRLQHNPARWERGLRFVLRWPAVLPGVPKNSDAAKRMLAMRKTEERPTTIDPIYAATVFRCDEEMLGKIGQQPVPMPPTLWGIFTRDRETDPLVSLDSALRISGPGSALMNVTGHNPWWTKRIATQIAAAMFDFQEGRMISNMYSPLTHDSVHALLGTHRPTIF